MVQSKLIMKKLMCRLLGHRVVVTQWRYMRGSSVCAETVVCLRCQTRFSLHELVRANSNRVGEFSEIAGGSVCEGIQIKKVLGPEEKASRDNRGE